MRSHVDGTATLSPPPVALPYASRRCHAPGAKVQGARGEADRFTKVLTESRKDLAATRRRLYLEALAELLPRFSRKVVVAPGHDLDISLFTEGGPKAAGGATPAPAAGRR